MSATLQTGEVTVTIEIGGEEISFSSGRMAKQADGAVVVRSGETMVLATAVGRTEAREGIDFFPLTVDIEEKMYAAGKIPGGFFKREGKASEKATLNARMVDRPIRPLWPKGFQNEVQVIATVLSIDGVHAHDILAINGASAALVVSSLPFLGPIGAVRIGRFGDELVVNPLDARHGGVVLDLIVCGTADAITMVEAGAKVVQEDVLIEALELAHREIRRLCELQLELREKVGKPKWYDPAVKSELDARYGQRFDAALAEQGLAGIAAAEAALIEAELPAVTGNTGEDAMVRRTQVQFAARMISEERRLKALVDPVREQFAPALRELSDAEQDSKELKSAKRAAVNKRIETELRLPFPSGAEGTLDPLAQELREEGRRRGLQVDRPPEDRGRQAAPRRPHRRGDPPDHLRGLGRPAHARLGALHPRPDAGADARHPWHRQGAAAHRRPVARHDEALHPPLQLPAVLGRRDGLHAGPEAP